MHMNMRNQLEKQSMGHEHQTAHFSQTKPNDFDDLISSVNFGVFNLSW